ncbi:MAG: rane dipeptidase [Clostridia bacterium]|nr:rane dipeptidase [Clostridia bacterium]
MFPKADAHCDTLLVLAKENLPLASGSGQVSLDRLRAGGVGLQFFAAFVDPEAKSGYLNRALALIDAFQRQVLTCPGVRWIKKAGDLELALAGGELAAVLAIEGGEVLEGELAILRLLFQLGVRCIGLTWNNRNALGDGVGETRSAGRLTAFGAEVVQAMNKLGMIVDLAHLNEYGFWDALDLSSAPVLVSHANCRALCNHPRNLTDAQLKALGEKRGVIGISFVSPFVAADSPDLERVVDHIIHAAAVAGIDHVALGSDFDGTTEIVPGLEGPERLQELPEALARRGLKNEEIEKILGRNLCRLLMEVLPRC